MFWDLFLCFSLTSQPTNSTATYSKIICTLTTFHYCHGYFWCPGKIFIWPDYLIAIDVCPCFASSLTLLLLILSAASRMSVQPPNNSDHFTPLFKPLQWFPISDSKPMSLQWSTRPQMICLSVYTSYLLCCYDPISLHFSHFPDLQPLPLTTLFLEWPCQGT